tara:strand:+ start:1020 stop:1142 length:123 start_codon:yes stop_codon:yes gene_type:complete
LEAIQAILMCLMCQGVKTAAQTFESGLFGLLELWKIKIKF